MNINELSVRLTQLEGKKKAVNIAQTKEIIRVLGVVFNELSTMQLFRLVLNIKRHGKEL